MLRKRTAVDELNVRQYFVEGELLVAEVQALYQDGGAALHTRSLSYGKLRNGFFLAVAGAGGEGGLSATTKGGTTRGGGGGGGGVVRSRRQRFTFPAARGAGDIEVILGVNGYIWIAKHVKPPAADARAVSITSMEESVSASIYSSQNNDVSPPIRREIARVAGCIRALVEWGARIDEAIVRGAYEAALEVEVEGVDGDAGEYADDYLGGERGRRVVELALSEMA